MHLNFFASGTYNANLFTSLRNDRLCAQASEQILMPKINLFLITVTSYFPILQITAERMQSAAYKAGKRS